MLLARVKLKVEHGLAAAETLLGARAGHISQAELWVLANGFFNGFYSIGDELAGQRKKDPILLTVYQLWDDDPTTSAFNFQMRAIRNKLTHQGDFEATTETAWVVDIANDTEHPFNVASFSIPGQTPGNMHALELQQWVRDKYGWWADQLDALEKAYVAAGGQAVDLWGPAPANRFETEALW